MKKSLVVVVAIGAASLALSACGSSSTGSSSSASVSASGSPSSSAAALVPAAVRDKGTLNVATEAQGPPFDSVDTSGQIVGADVDLMHAIADQLGLKLSYNNVGFDTIIPGMAGGRYDIGMSQFTDTKEREKVVDFVTYFKEGTSLMVAKGNPDNLSIDHLCGKTIAASKGGIEVDTILPRLSKACTDAGDAAIVVKVFNGQDAPNLAVVSGQVQGTLLDNAAASAIVNGSGGKLELVGEPIDVSPLGMAIAKNLGLTEAIHVAMNSLIASGEYKQILDKWGLGSGALTTSEVNVGS